MPRKYSSYEFTPTEALVLEVLTARHRLGDNNWTFSSRVNKAIYALEAHGLVNWKSAPVENHTLVWFTTEGKQLMLSKKWKPRIGWKALKKHNKQLRKEAK